MKRIFIIAVFISLAFSSCQKGGTTTVNNGNNTNPPYKDTTGYCDSCMTATVAERYIAPYTKSYRVYWQRFYNNTALLVGNFDGLNYSMRVSFPLSVGTYTDIGDITACNYGSGTSSGLYGVITVTAISPVLSGTFNFTCHDSTKVSNGTFAISGF